MLDAGEWWRVGRGPEGDDEGLGEEICDGCGWEGWV